jgi:cell wall-associated NlpC family hydrolase
LSYTIDDSSPLIAVAQLIDQKDKEIADYIAERSALVTQLATANQQVQQLTAQVTDLRNQVPSKEAWEVKADKVIATAMDLYDAHVASGDKLFPYVFGGEPKLDKDNRILSGSFDCSAFTQYIFKVNGIMLKRTSYNQAAQGKEVTLAEIRKGDLICYDLGDSRQTLNGVDHVVMYIGNGQLIQSNPSGGGLNVRIVSDFYPQRIVTVRRVI